MGFHDEPGVSILITNISDTLLIITQHLGATKFESVWADARDLSQFKNNEFDVVFSNSVIEHVGAIKDQEAMMREVQRVGKRFWVQTPNYWFPIEPHFHFIGFQFLPVYFRAWLLNHFSLGWMTREKNFFEARKLVQQTRLLTRRELGQMDPEASIYDEKLLGFVKSITIFKGWHPS